MKPKCAITSAEANVPDLRSRFAQHTPNAVEKNGPCGPCKTRKPNFLYLSRVVGPYLLENRLKDDRWRQLSALVGTVHESDLIVAKDRCGQTVGLASLFHRRYLNINRTGDSVCSQA